MGTGNSCAEGLWNTFSWISATEITQRKRWPTSPFRWYRQRHITLICRHKLHTAAAVALLCHRQSKHTAYRPQSKPAPTDFVMRLVMDDSEISMLDLIRFLEKKISILNYERFLPSIKDLSDACVQWLVRLVWPLLFHYFSDSYACEPIIPYGRLAKIKISK